MRQKLPDNELRVVDQLAVHDMNSGKRNGASDRFPDGTPSAQECGQTPAAPGRMECGGNVGSTACHLAYPQSSWVGTAFGYIRKSAMIHRFLCSTRAGATAYVAAAVALMTVLGGALITDHVWLIDKRDLLKNAASAASLTATAELATLPRAMSDADVSTHLHRLAHDYVWINVRANTRSDLERDDVVVELDINRTAGIVNATVEADIGETLFSFLYGGPESVRQATAAEQQFRPAEIVLAIDTSGSMNGDLDGRSVGRTRIDIVREAANSLIDTLASDNSGAVAMGLVPWTEVVRLQWEDRNRWHREGWSDFPSRRLYLVPYGCQPRATCVPETAVQDIPRETRGTWHGCIDENRILNGVTELPAMENALELPSRTAFAESYFTPGGDFGGRAYQCLGDTVPANFDLQFCWADASNENRQFQLTNPQRSCSGVSPMRPLTTDLETVRRAVNGLAVPGQATYSALGIQWGRRMLSPAWRAVWGGGTHPIDTDRGVPKIIVLLTDGADNICGDNDPECESGLAVGRDQACEAAKAEGIEIFVVAAMAPRHVSRDLGRALRDCATSPEHAYINNPDTNALLDAFRSIATELVSLRRIS